MQNHGSRWRQPFGLLLLAGALSSLGCRERVELRAGTGSGEAGAPALSLPGAGGAAERAASADARDSPGAPTKPERSRRAAPELTTCPRPDPPEACQISGDSASGVRIIGTLLEPTVVRARGVLDIDAGGRIRCVGCDCGEAQGALVIDCPGLVVSPGFVNLHDHLGYARTPPLSHPGELYEHRNDWRLGEHGHTALPFEGGASAAQVLAHELRMLMGGTTSIVGAGGRRGLVRNLDVAGGTEGLLAGAIRAETFPLDDARGEVDSAACSFGDHADSAESIASAQAYVAHLGEGTNQRAQDELGCALGNLDLLGQNSAIVHAMALSRADAHELSRRGASVVWSPRSNLDLYGSTAPVALLTSLGVPIALGTDWLASGSMNQLRELRCAQSYDHDVLGGYFNAFELWRMVTSHPAWALGLEGRFAALKAGLVADVAVFEERTDDAYASVVGAGPADVKLVLREGAPLYGASQLVAAFQGGPACEVLEVCGAEQRVCSAETGLSLAELRAAGEAIYPLFSCEDPPDEPSCSAQVGAECLAGEASCRAPPAPPAWDERDVDADGVPDLEDVCPRVADSEQADSDDDGVGDACDSCPTFNPGLSPCPCRIAELRSLAVHTAVQLRSVRVTALRITGSKGYYVEDGDRAPYSGIFVYTGDKAPKVAPGDLLDLRGYFDVYQGTAELVDAQVLAQRAAADDYAPQLVAISELSDGSATAAAFASRLVRIEDAVVEASNPDAPKDYDETLLFGGLRLDDLLASEIDNRYAVGTIFGSVEGIAGFSFGHQKLYPLALDAGDE